MAEDGKLREYLALIDQKKAKFQDILKIARSQEDMAERGDAQELDESMERRVSIGEDVDRLDARCAVLRRELGTLAVSGSGAVSEAESSLVAIIRQIQSVDRANAAALSAKIGEYQKSIKQMRLSSKGREVYAQTFEQTDGIFFDVKK
jgi:flagellar biosynthesis/type III secretory pathway chaperone